MISGQNIIVKHSLLLTYNKKIFKTEKYIKVISYSLKKAELCAAKSQLDVISELGETWKEMWVLRGLPESRVIY